MPDLVIENFRECGPHISLLLGSLTCVCILMLCGHGWISQYQSKTDFAPCICWGSPPWGKHHRLSIVKDMGLPGCPRTYRPWALLLYTLPTPIAGSGCSIHNAIRSTQRLWFSHLCGRTPFHGFKSNQNGSCDISTYQFRRRDTCVCREKRSTSLGSTQIQREATLAQWILALLCHHQSGAPKDS